MSNQFDRFEGLLSELSEAETAVKQAITEVENFELITKATNAKIDFNYR